MSQIGRDAENPILFRSIRTVARFVPSGRGGYVPDRTAGGAGLGAKVGSTDHSNASSIRKRIAFANWWHTRGRRAPFYGDLYRDIDPNQFDLADLPVVNKTAMMGNFDRFLTDRSLRQSDIEAFVSEPKRLGEWYRGQYSVSRTSGTQGLQALIVQSRPMVELLHAIQMGRGTVFPTDPKGILQRLFERARLAVVTIGRGFYPSAAALAYAPPAARMFVDRLWLEHIEPLEEVVERLNTFRPHILLAYANVLEILAREAMAGRLRRAA